MSAAVRSMSPHFSHVVPAVVIACSDVDIHHSHRHRRKVLNSYLRAEAIALARATRRSSAISRKYSAPLRRERLTHGGTFHEKGIRTEA